MKYAVCVPWRPGDVHREKVWAFLRDVWEYDYGLPVFTGNNGEDRFSAARARNLAADAAGDWDAALFVDADVLVGIADQAHAALEQAVRTGGYVAAYDRLHWLDEAETEKLMDDVVATAYFSISDTWLNAFAIGRELWDAVGGFNEARWLGVGGEDVAFFQDASAPNGCSRVPGDAYHLYHPPRPSKWT